jgi:hypothetical protein
MADMICIESAEPSARDGFRTPSLAETSRMAGAGQTAS